MLRSDRDKGSIAHLYGPLQGMVHAGLHKFLATKDNWNVSNVNTFEDFQRNCPQPQMGDPLDTNDMEDDMEDHVCNIVLNMVTNVRGNDLFMRHLLTGIICMKGS